MTIKKYFYAAVLIAAASGVQSCSSEAPFQSEGEGVLRINTEFRSDFTITTRADFAGYSEDDLNNKLVVYIEKKNKGLVKKFLGKDEIPESFTLSKGDYVVEGWSGDSVSADFNKKFFRGYNGNVSVGDGINNLSLKLDIANVIVSIDPAVLNLGINDLKVKVYHSRGELVFTEDLIANGQRGYFMLPNAEKDLNFIIEGIKTDGSPLNKSGKIENVERRHLYNMVFSTEESEITQGGALIRLEIQDIDVIEESFEILPPPTFKMLNAGKEYDIDKQVISTDHNFNDVAVRTLIYQGSPVELKPESLTLSFSSNFTDLQNLNGVNILEEEKRNELKSKGIDCRVENVTELSNDKKNNEVKIIETWVSLTAEFLNNLRPSNEEYTVTFTAQDDRGYVASGKLRIANTEDAIERVDPVESAPVPDVQATPMAILAGSAELTGYLYDDESDADYGFEYCEEGQENWYKVSAKGTALATKASVKSYVVKLTGLKANTTYKYRAYHGEFVEDFYNTFTTESKYQFPNADMSQWSQASDKAFVPSPDGKVSFWDSGNHGSILMDVNLTQKDESFIPGNAVARLRSEYVNLFGMGKMAAGNLFIGEFAGRDGTDGILHLGREYNASHPSALTVKANYRPAQVKSNGSKNGYLTTGQYDHGQIYIALTSEIVEIRTKSSNQKLFNPDGEEIIAYGQISWDDENGKGFGEDGKLELVNIPFIYKNKAKTIAPKYIIVVCSASKYGDYFCGGDGSIMYLDDFELEYGEIQFEN